MSPRTYLIFSILLIVLFFLPISESGPKMLTTTKTKYLKIMATSVRTVTLTKTSTKTKTKTKIHTVMRSTTIKITHERFLSPTRIFRRCIRDNGKDLDFYQDSRRAALIRQTPSLADFDKVQITQSLPLYPEDSPNDINDLSNLIESKPGPWELEPSLHENY